MSTQEQSRSERIDRWLESGGIVLAANERAARSLAAAFGAARRREGCAAWTTPAIFSWESWVRLRWLERNRTGLVLLNPLQEQALWSRIIRESQIGRELLHPGQLAAAAQQAHRLLASFAPRAFRPAARSGWAGDAVAFSEWLAEFDMQSRREGLVSASRIGLLLTEALQDEAGLLFADPKRPALLLIGFDRVLETQRAVLNAWGEWREDATEKEARSAASFLACDDGAAELDACVSWLRRRIAEEPKARLMVVTTGLQARRGELERALLDNPQAGEPELDFEFSLGVPLGRVGLARAALLILRWLRESLAEPELDWLLSSGFAAASAVEELSLTETMNTLRRRGQERPEWTLEQWLSPGGYEITPSAAWAARMRSAQVTLERAPRRQSPLDWAPLAARLLEIAGWLGFRPLDSAAYQARQRWDAVLESCASLGFDGSQMEWPEFVATLGAAVADAIFAAESHDAPIQITEPLESAGQLADGLWFLGADEENWPGRGQPHPLLPIGLQRETGMPHSSPQADWSLAHEATERLLTSAGEVIFSYARQSGEAEERPSRLVSQYLGSPVLLPATKSRAKAPLTFIFEDTSRIPFPHTAIRGGAATLTRQSQCPFQAFAMARLDATDWQAAEVGLNAKQRGQLLHEVLHRVWGGEAVGGLATLEDLLSLADLPAFVRGKVDSVLVQVEATSFPGRFPRRLLELEADRLTTLIAEWLEYERTRPPFTVDKTEARSEVTIAGLTIRLRMDRIDRLADGSKLVIDYKSSDVGPGAWAGDRLDDIQLPLYATFAKGGNDEPNDKPLEGLAYARVRPGDTRFYGRVRSAGTLVHPGLDPRGKNPLNDEQLREWRELIEQLGRDFVEGDVKVDPKNGAKTCDKCHLHALCRVYENEPLALLNSDDEDGEEESDTDGARGGDV